jgi:hypothetical protein
LFGAAGVVGTVMGVLGLASWPWTLGMSILIGLIVGRVLFTGDDR